MPPKRYVVVLSGFSSIANGTLTYCRKYSTVELRIASFKAEFSSSSAFGVAILFS
jgi:hypothetical protein